MTKTLTEQWREGTLPEGLYYVKDWDGTINRFWAQNNIIWRDSNNPIYASERIEVLAPVPSYEEYNELLRHSELSRNLVYEVLVNQKEYNELLDKAKEYKRLQEQLNEANKALKDVCMHAETEHFECRCGWVEPCKDCNAHYSARNYLEKWGVK